MSYREAVRYLESCVNYEKASSYPYKKVLKLERIAGFLNLIHNPERALKCIHVAGTKGKGSTAAFSAYILRQAGFKVGLYTSPHLIDFRERFRILRPGRNLNPHPGEFEGCISKLKFGRLMEELKPAIEKYNRYSKYGPLTFFEATTALAFVYFKEENVDFAVLETGLGGRLDATNVIRPLVCIITPISYEHMDKLGSTLEAIAREKAGIIKDRSSVISALQQAPAQKVIRAKARAAEAILFEFGRDIRYRKTGSSFCVRGLYREYKDLKIRLYGRHQLMNATLALAAVESLRPYGFHIGVDSIRGGLYNTLWPGRCEIVAKNPRVILDGAQNAASALALKQAVQENFKYQRLILVLGVSSDKDIKGMSIEFRGWPDSIIFTRANHPRSASPELLSKYFKAPKQYITANTGAAKEIARRVAQRKDLVLVTGSLFVVGEFKNDQARFN